MYKKEKEIVKGIYKVFFCTCCAIAFLKYICELTVGLFKSTENKSTKCGMYILHSFTLLQSYHFIRVILLYLLTFSSFRSLILFFNYLFVGALL